MIELMLRHTKRLKIQTGLSFVLFLFMPWTAFANSVNWYQVNVIFFTQVTNTYYNVEKWGNPDPLPAKPSWQRLSTQPSQKAFTILPKKQFQLSSEEMRLRNSPHYRVILATSWIQPISSNNSSPIFLKGGKQFDKTGNTSEIQGLLTFKKTNYIEIDANLRLTKPSDQLLSQEQSLFSEGDYQTFALIQTQRLRPNELHYFDHPLFGMLITLTPYTPSADILSESDPMIKPVTLDTNTPYKIRP